MTPFALGMGETVEQAEERCAKIPEPRQPDHDAHVLDYTYEQSWQNAVIYNEYIARQRDELV